MVLDYLLKKEWSDGNGQCPECCGVPERWPPHPLFLTPETLGHKPDCDLAQSIEEVGGEPLYLGQSLRKDRWRTKRSGVLQCVPEDEPYSKLETQNLDVWQERLDQILFEMLTSDLEDQKDVVKQVHGKH